MLFGAFFEDVALFETTFFLGAIGAIISTSSSSSISSKLLFDGVINPEISGCGVGVIEPIDLL